ncbi:DEAD/DEAH box helicase [Thalassotalea eurytherma]|uniref:ATP-dependent RNA helicase RhlE n=1 Tax=Thalassotalea eurytherma TaxID=1144278 RepID=A0ABQ6H3L6_9GAMM|nr:DEAD/DEAH box helicase [Thalassotalea eurytherma]GLX82768.1 ATP-dependent RNA helicase RhlE [Thalassotalea eurytherma]
MTFSSLGLAPQILSALEEKGYTEPSPIQAQAIPKILEGKDVMAAAQTGTGKTAGFVLPILQQLHDNKEKIKVSHNHTKVLILTPTRELAAQISDNIETYAKHLKVTSTVVYGGVKINPQMMRLRNGIDILVATPGRLLDLYSQNAIKFSQLSTLVLDEADRMLDMGFIRDIEKIIRLLPKKRQNLLFSATFSPEIRELAKGIVVQPSEISVTPENTTADTITHWLVPADKKRKPQLLAHLIKEENLDQVLVFSRTKHGANKLVKFLDSQDIEALAIHGNKSQGARNRALQSFKDKTIKVLVATDIASRGIDISQLPIVVNFDLPNVQEDYVHRIGRTGRAGVDGQAISLVSADEIDQLQDIEYVIQQHIERRDIAGFTPHNPLPESRAIRPYKKKKPKKPKKKVVEQRSGKQGDKPSRSSNHDKSHAGKGPKKPNQSNRNKRHTTSDSKQPAKGRHSPNKSRHSSSNKPKSNTSN